MAEDGQSNLTTQQYLSAENKRMIEEVLAQVAQ